MHKYIISAQIVFKSLCTLSIYKYGILWYNYTCKKQKKKKEVIHMLFILVAILLTMFFTALPVGMTKDCLKRKAYFSLICMYAFAFVGSATVIMTAIDIVA